MDKKLLKKKRVGSGRSAYDCVQEELKVLQKLNHPNIIFLHEIIDDKSKDHIYLVTQWLTQGTLKNLVDEKNQTFKQHNKSCKEHETQTVGLPSTLARIYFQDIVKALHYCHKVCKVIHRDIKPENIGINHNGEAVLIDFGICADLENQKDDILRINMGSYLFYAPEMFSRGNDGLKVHGEKTDIWALGLTLFFLLCGRSPWEQAKNPLHLKDLILHSDINFDLIKNEEARTLLKQILTKDPEKRISLE